MIKNLIIIAFLTIGLFGACKRYEEDPFTLKTPKKRIEGSWKLISFTVNGADSMEFFKSPNYDGNWIFGTTEYSQGYVLSITSNTNKGMQTTGYWNFWDFKEYITFNINGHVPRWFLVNNGNYSIKKLTTSELKIEDNSTQKRLFFTK